jgi:hypothetical protein
LHALNLLKTTPGVVEDFKIEKCKSQTTSPPTHTLTQKQLVIWRQKRELERYKLDLELKRTLESRSEVGSDLLLSDKVEGDGSRVGEVLDALLDDAAPTIGEGNEDGALGDDEVEILLIPPFNRFPACPTQLATEL